MNPFHQKPSETELKSEDDRLKGGIRMFKNRIMYPLMVVVLSTISLLLAPDAASAHCDGLDGPVVAAARKALDSGDVNLVHQWVQEVDEAEIEAAFEKTLNVRKLNPQAKELADTYFFETLVRVHRAGEGAAYTGLKPAGRDLGPAIPAGDEAIKTGSVEALLRFLTERMHNELGKRFQKVIERSKYPVEDVSAGREYVKAYVEYIHYVEGLYEAAVGSRDSHGSGSAEGASHDNHNAGLVHAE